MKITHVAFLRHLLANPLEHGDSTGQHDHDVQILTDVFVTCSAELQPPLNPWLSRSVVCSLGTWPSKSANSEMLSIWAQSLSIYADVSDQADRHIILCRHHSNAINPKTSCWPQTSSSRNRHVKNCNRPQQPAFVKTHHKMASLGHPRWSLAALATAAAAQLPSGMATS